MPDEVLVYDMARDKAHCLNRTGPGLELLRRPDQRRDNDRTFRARIERPG